MTTSANENEFYMVLPSNACPQIHPQNNASNYTVTWESPVDLTSGKWKVALTEAGFNRPPTGKLNEKFGIEYEWRIKYKRKFWYYFKFSTKTKKIKNNEGKKVNRTIIDQFQVKEYYNKGQVKEFTSNPFDSNYDDNRASLPVVDDTNVFDEATNGFLENEYARDEPKRYFSENWHKPYVTLTTADHMKIQTKFPFSIIFEKAHQSELCGFERDTLTYFSKAEHDNYGEENGFYVLISPKPIKRVLEKEKTQPDDVNEPSFPIKFWTTMVFYTPPLTVTNTKFVSGGNDNFNSISELKSYIEMDFGNIFEEVQLVKIGNTSDQTFSFKVRKGIQRLKLLNGFNIALGFQDRFLDVPIYNLGRTIKGQHPARLFVSYQNLYIYSDICEPILVGGIRAPLLRNVYLELKENGGSGGSRNRVGEICHVSIKNPMYIKTFASSINSIEVHVRADSGQLIPFSAGSVTILTLHFKRTE